MPPPAAGKPSSSTFQALVDKPEIERTPQVERTIQALKKSSFMNGKPSAYFSTPEMHIEYNTSGDSYKVEVYEHQVAQSLTALAACPDISLIFPKRVEPLSSHVIDVLCGVLTALQKCAALWGELLYTGHGAGRCFHTTVRAVRDLWSWGCIVFTFRCRCRRANEASGREGLNYMHTKMKGIHA